MDDFKLLLELNRLHVELISREWCRSFPKDGGVYCFFVDDKLSYVGETGYLRKRLSDLLDFLGITLFEDQSVTNILV